MQRETQPILPPSPKIDFPRGLEACYLEDPIATTAKIAKEGGDIAHFRIRDLDVFFLNKAEYVRDVLVTKNRYVVKTEAPVGPKNEAVGGTEGEYHHRHRRLMQPAFHQERLNGYVGLIVDAIRETRDRWSDGNVIDIEEEMHNAMRKMNLKFILSMDIDDPRNKEFVEADRRMGDLGSDPEVVQARLDLVDHPRAVEVREKLESLVVRKIQERRALGENDPHDDILSMMIHARDTDGTGAMTDREIKAEMLSFLAASRDTVVNATTWAWYCLSQNPEAEAKLHEEVDIALDGDRLPGVEDVPKLKYASMVLSEALRMYPVIWSTPRLAAEDLTVGGYSIPAGSMMMLSQYATHHDPRYFPEPEAFKPERWTPDLAAKVPKIAYFPFLAGPHVCIGEPLAWLEGVMVLATVAQKWNLRLAEGTIVEMDGGVGHLRYGGPRALGPMDCMPMVPTRRKSSGSAGTEA